MIDGAVVLPFLAGIDIGADAGSQAMLWYSTALAAKFALLVLFRRERAALGGPAKAFLIGMTIMVAATLLAGIITPSPYYNAIGFLLHLTLTLTLAGRRIKPYLGGVLALLIPAAAIHIVYCLTHRVGELWGRYLYFANAQPNLGGEIDGAAALAAAFTLRRAPALGALALLLVDMSLLQARSAVLVDLAAAVVVIFHDPQKQATLRRTLAMLLGAVLFTVGVLALGGGGKVFGVFNDLLLIDNQYRGVSSGASGRLDLWQTAIDLFVASPLYGHALGYFPTIGYIGSHNLFLLGLAQFGALSLLFFGALLYAYGHLFRVDRFRFWVMITALPLFAFNDRLLNLNPYPFLIYVMLLLPGPAPDPAEAPGRLKPYPRPGRPMQPRPVRVAAAGAGRGGVAGRDAHG